MKQLLGDEYPAFEAALQEETPVSIRYRPEFISNASTEAEAVPWHPLGRYLPERPVFTLDPTFHAGAYYVQEASSMFLHEALRQTVDFSNKLKVLDLCAAPGGKTTLVADMIGPDSLLVANEVIRSRLSPLRENMERWGCPNTAIVSAEAETFGEMEGWFDIVVCDAPCSGEGLFRKDPDAVQEWSPAQVELCAGRQQRILSAAVQALAPGGVLVYSTCTYNRLENEENVAWLTGEQDLELLRLDVPAAWNIADGGAGLHFYPHRTRGEGFFIAVFRKKEGPGRKASSPTSFKSIQPLSKNLVPEASRWLQTGTEARFFLSPSEEVLALPSSLETDYLFLDKHLKTKWFGVNIGAFKGKDFIPSHALALSRWISSDLPALDLNLEQALLFLKKETFDVPSDAPRGWSLARFKGMNLGWMKILPNRMNNYLPPERRIRMSLTS